MALGLPRDRQVGQVIDVFVSARRDAEAARDLPITVTLPPLGRSGPTTHTSLIFARKHLHIPERVQPEGVNLCETG